MDFSNDERFDGLYMNVAQTTRGIEPMLDTVFSFLRRKTDFFAGPPASRNGNDDDAQAVERGQKAAIAKVQEVLMKHADIYAKEQAEKRKKAQAKKQKSKKKPQEEQPAAAAVVEMGKDGGFDISSQASTPAATTTATAKDVKTTTTTNKEQQEEPKETSTPPSSSQSDAAGKKDENGENTKKDDSGDGDGDAKGDDDPDEKRGPPPVGNGGVVEGKYVWTQTLGEVNVHVMVPDNTRGKDLDVVIAKKHLKVGLRSEASTQGKWIIDAPLTKPVICDDSFWLVEDGNRLVLTLQKLNQMEWWNSVVEGDPKIDVRAIQPENSSLADLDGDTRQTVEKMMYDQRQKALGLPTSEEEKKLAMLEKFKAQHPELDFSNATIN